MDGLEFLKHAKVLEDRIRQLTPKGLQLPFLGVVAVLENKEYFDTQTISRIKKIWKLRNMLYSLPAPEDAHVPDEIKIALRAVNTYLQQ